MSAGLLAHPDRGLSLKTQHDFQQSTCNAARDAYVHTRAATETTMQQRARIKHTLTHHAHHDVLLHAFQPARGGHLRQHQQQATRGRQRRSDVEYTEVGIALPPPPPSRTSRRQHQPRDATARLGCNTVLHAHRAAMRAYPVPRGSSQTTTAILYVRQCYRRATARRANACRPPRGAATEQRPPPHGITAGGAYGCMLAR